MESKAVLFCALFLVKNALAQCFFPQAALVESLGIYDPRISIGPSPISALPIGLSLPSPSFSIESDGLLINGPVEVFGTLPFTGAVILEGILPTSGQGTVLYNTGAGEVEIIREIPYDTRPYENPKVARGYQRPGLFGLY